MKNKLLSKREKSDKQDKIKSMNCFPGPQSHSYIAENIWFIWDSFAKLSLMELFRKNC